MGLYLINGASILEGAGKVTTPTLMFNTFAPENGGKIDAQTRGQNFEKMVFMTSFESLQTTPIPHRNLFEFRGMPDYKQVLLTRTDPIRGTFSALLDTGKMLVWGI